MPGHKLGNIIDGDTLVDRPPERSGSEDPQNVKPPVPVVQTILYYDVPDMKRYKDEKDAVNKALTQLEKTRAERRSKSSTKRSQIRGTRVKEEPEEPEIHYVQAHRPARGYIPVQSLLGPFVCPVRHLLTLALTGLCSQLFRRILKRWNQHLPKRES